MPKRGSWTSLEAIQRGARGIALAVALNAGAACAATATVTNLDDSGAGSLRDTIANAAGGDTIDFQSGLTGSIVLTTGELSFGKNLIIEGPGADVITISGNSSSRIINCTSGNLTISGLTLTGGSASGRGGAIQMKNSLTISDCVITGNTATGSGGAIADNKNGAFNNNLTMTNCVVTGNSSTGGRGGGAVYLYAFNKGVIEDSTISGNTATGRGGGVYFYGNAQPFEFTNSTLSGNTAGSTGGAIFLGDDDSGSGAFFINGCTLSGNTAGSRGGAIDAPQDALDAFLTITNSTISGNKVTNGTASGVYMVPGSGGSKIRDVTIADNTADAGGGGALVTKGNSLSLEATIVGANTDASGNYDLVRISGTVNASYSLIQTSASGAVNGTDAGNVTGLDPLLGPLQDNGGSTYTMMPLVPSSPALNASYIGESSDQRGVARPQGLMFEIGAVEVAEVDSTVDPKGPDRDGDGVNNDIDPDPDDPNVAGPYGELSLPGLPVKSVAMKFDFANPGRDRITAAGTIQMNLPIFRANTTVDVDIGGLTQSFTLDENGVGVTGDDTFKMKINRFGYDNGTFKAKWKLSMKKGTFAVTDADGAPFDGSTPGTEDRVLKIHMTVKGGAPATRYNAGTVRFKSSATKGSAKTKYR